MIIKNNYNNKSVDPLSDYNSIRNRCDDNVNKENNKKMRKLTKKIMDKLTKDDDSEYEDDEEDELNDWHF